MFYVLCFFIIIVVCKATTQKLHIIIGKTNNFNQTCKILPYQSRRKP